MKGVEPRYKNKLWNHFEAYHKEIVGEDKLIKEAKIVPWRPHALKVIGRNLRGQVTKESLFAKGSSGTPQVSPTDTHLV